MGKGVSETGMRVLNAGHATAENNPSRDDDEQQQYNLEDGEEVHAVYTDFGEEGVNSSDGDDDSDGNATLCPVSRNMTSRDDNVGSKNDASGS